MLLNHQRLPMFLALVAGAAMLSVTAWQGYSFWRTESRQMTQKTIETGSNALPPGQQAPQVNLSSFDLFGTATKTANEETIDTENLPETNLRLYLRGVLAASGEFPGSALIEDDKSKTEVYLVGDELPGNATLRSVYPNRVIIERSGKLENLLFPESDDRSGMSFASNVEENEPAPAGSQPATSPSSTPSSTVDENQRREEIRRRLEQLRERLRNNNN